MDLVGGVDTNIHRNDNFFKNRLNIIIWRKRLLNDQKYLKRYGRELLEIKI